MNDKDLLDFINDESFDIFDFNSYQLTNQCNKDIIDLCNEFHINIECVKHARNVRSKIYRIYKKIVYAYCRSKYMSFLTLTINDTNMKYFKDLHNLNRRFKGLFDNIKFYIFHNDIGSNGRLHFHCIIFNDTPITKDLFDWSYGFIDLKEIKSPNKAITKYLIKYSTHTSNHNKQKIRSNIREYQNGSKYSNYIEWINDKTFIESLD